jgi:MoaA/NifB/PqqE/SkfB family radical SAM enzyme
MINYADIRQVHLEISTRCNAACPDCPRNLRGVDVIDSYPVTDMSLTEFQQIFPQEFLKQLTIFLINGNHGDFITAADGLKIVEYIRQCNPDVFIDISTNASGKPKIWEPLAAVGVTVQFRLDGLADTHHLYRQNTDFDLIISNAKKFIAASKNHPRSRAHWVMIPFDHNRHQIAECRKLSQDLGFHKFEICDAGRNIMPVFDSKRNFSHVIGNYTESINFADVHEQYLSYITNTEVELAKLETMSTAIRCPAKLNQEIYVSANGEVYPCCWLGFYPNYGDKTRPLNHQLRPLIFKNNALEHGLESTIEWFSGVEQSWNIPTVQSGRIHACDSICGVRK